MLRPWFYSLFDQNLAFVFHSQVLYYIKIFQHWKECLKYIFHYLTVPYVCLAHNLSVWVNTVLSDKTNICLKLNEIVPHLSSLFWPQVINDKQQEELNKASSVEETWSKFLHLKNFSLKVMLNKVCYLSWFIKYLPSNWVEVENF